MVNSMYAEMIKMYAEIEKL